jgi:hypothetical protein
MALNEFAQTAESQPGRAKRNDYEDADSECSYGVQRPRSKRDDRDRQYPES